MQASILKQNNEYNIVFTNLSEKQFKKMIIMHTFDHDYKKDIKLICKNMSKYSYKFRTEHLLEIHRQIKTLNPIETEYKNFDIDILFEIKIDKPLMIDKKHNQEFIDEYRKQAEIAILEYFVNH